MNEALLLFVAANPSSQSQLDLAEEVRAIQGLIRSSELRDSLRLESRWAARADDLLQSLNELRPAILHFSGHGSNASEIVFQRSDGQEHPVDPKALQAVFRSAGQSVRLVFLNACFSKDLARKLTKVVDVAIGMDGPVTDTAARCFAASFYLAIGFGQSVQQAFDQGKAALLMEEPTAAHLPRLILRKGLDADHTFLVGDSALQSHRVQLSTRALREKSISLEQLRLMPDIEADDVAQPRASIVTRMPTSTSWASPDVRNERLTSNLMKVKHYATSIYTAKTSLTKPDEVWKVLKQSGYAGGGEWVVWNKLLVSFHDLSSKHWAGVCEQGTVERDPSDGWANADMAKSDDRLAVDKRNMFVRLLYKSLTANLYPRVRFDKNFECYAFALPRRRTRGTKVGRTTVCTPMSNDGRTSCWRHLAFHGQFVRFDADWYLSVTPDYIFTIDGKTPYPFHDKLLSGIKRLEQNKAVLASLRLWMGHLSEDRALVDRTNDFLRLERVPDFALNVGINDSSWKVSDNHEPQANERLAFGGQQ